MDALRATAPECLPEIELYATPRSRNDRTAAGLVIVLPRRARLANPFSAEASALGWGCDRVLIPVESRIFPALDSAEIPLLFPYACHFLHPTEGLFGFEAEDRLSPASLLAKPTITGEDWSRAVPPPPPIPKLHRLELHIPIDLDDFMDQIAGDIGEAKRDPEKDDKSGPIKKTGQFLGRLGGGLIGGMAAGLQKLFGSGSGARNKPSGEAGEAWLDKIAKWGAQQWKELHDARERELQKLLKLFESDPSEALRHALPLAGDAARGAAPPGTHLGPRDTRLNVGGGRGGPVDQWNLDYQKRAALEKRYREAAAQAMRDGNYERAAYIYGELLGDWAKAADALQKGGRPRDAARIYLERLSNKSLAAQCYAEAGMLWEAIELYREMGLHEQAGDLLVKLGREEEAQAEYRLAADATDDVLTKARILEKKCNAPEEALAVLAAAWPLTRQACECLQARFELLGRLERHEEAVRLVHSLEHAPFSPPRALLDAMLQIGSQYPHPEVRREIEPVAVAIIGRELSRSNAPSTESTLLLQRLPKFAPEDRLLARDASRFRPPKPTPTIQAQTASILHPVSSFKLGLDAKWQSLSWSDDRLSLAGLKKGGKLVVGTLAPGEEPKLSQLDIPELPADTTEIRHIIAGVWVIAAARVFHDPARRSVYFHSLNVPYNIEAISSLYDVLAVCRAGSDEWCLVRIAETGGILAEYYSQHGSQRRSTLIDYAAPEQVPDTHIAARGRSLWIGVGNSLCWHPADDVFKVIGLDAAVSSVSLAPEFCGEQVLVTAADQVTLVTVSNPKRHEIETVNLLGGTTAHAVACFTNNGFAVALSEDGGLLYDVKSGVRETARITWPPVNGRPIAIAPFGDAHFAVLAENQTLLIYGH